MLASETKAEEEYSEVSDSVAYSLIEDLVRNKKVVSLQNTHEIVHNFRYLPRMLNSCGRSINACMIV